MNGNAARPISRQALGRIPEYEFDTVVSKKMTKIKRRSFIKS
jgi:hypothetical protein